MNGDEKKEFDNIIENRMEEKPFIIEDEKIYDKKGFFSKIKNSIGIIILIILLIACIVSIFSLFSMVSTIKEHTADLTKKMDALKAIKASTSELESKIEGLKKENEALKTEISEIKNEIEKLKAAKAKTAPSQPLKQAGQAKQKRR
ncbi:MAG: hypothetical protein N2596_06215 [Syntrophorhabdaceae bacterium]|nr:hypothetical protein [Syntrophorhabdaceae bacterium]